MEWQQLSIRVLPTTRAQSFFSSGSRGRVVKAMDLKSIGVSREGSNPTDYEHCLVGEHSFYKERAS